jgi:iron complex outermembrane recepter protein
MKFQKLSMSIRLALIASTTLVAPAAFAQEETEQTLEEINVLGSRIKRTDTETASPVLVIDAAAIERSGAATLGDVIQELPAIAGAATNPSVNNGGGDGAATISLRGLGDQRTLLLINGRRVAYNDINSIPANLVATVSILKDGASAIYGSDAIGGVVDFQLKTDFEGAQVSLDYGVSGEDDGERKGGSAAFGISGERGNFVVNLNYSDQEQISAADRDYSRNALTLYSGSVTVGGSSRTATGRYVVPVSVAQAGGVQVTPSCIRTGATQQNVVLTRQTGRAGTQISDFRCFSNASDLYNYQAIGNLQLTPQERAGLFFAGNFNVTDSVTAYAQAWTQNTRSAFAIAPLPFDGRPGQDEIVLSGQSIYNPFRVDITDGRLRLERIGNRSTEFETDSKQINAGVRGDIGESGWTWDLGYTFGKVDQTASVGGYPFFAAVENAVGPSFIDATGVARCGTPGNVIAGCVPLDFFGAPPDASTAAGRAQLAALAAISTRPTNQFESDLKVYSANFTGGLFELEAGEVGAAFGLERREESLNFVPDFLARLNSGFTCLISSEACTTATSGETSLTEAYGEVLVPILADAPFAERLNLTAGARWSDYDTFGSTTNGKVGFEWKPIGDLLIRGTFAQVFRAPTITDLFGGQTAASDSFSDPCNGYGAPGAASARNAQRDIACRNVTPNGTFQQSDTQLSAIAGGNGEVQPEEGEVVTIGFVYSPEFVAGLSTTLDIWDVKLEETIGAFGSQNILTGCYNLGVLCDRYSRGTDGEILRLFNSTDNVGLTETNGVDLGLRYNFDTESFGNFRINVDTSYIDKYDTTVVIQGSQGAVSILRRQAGTYTNPSAGGDGNYSRIRSLGNLAWNYGNFEAAWTSRYIHGFVVGSDNPNSNIACADASGAWDPIGDAGTPQWSCRFARGAQTYHNLSLGYKLEPFNTQFRFGVDNVFDKQPPFVYQNNGLNGNIDERTFDTVGRAYWISASAKF